MIWLLLISALLPPACALRARTTAVNEQLVPALRRKWPPHGAGELRHTWDFQVRMPADPCATDPAGTTCTGQLVASPREASGGLKSGPSYIVRAVGPTIEVCTTTSSRSGRDFVTLFTCRMRGSGAYELQPMLTYENQEEAFVAPPMCSSTCICSDLLASNSSFPTFVAPNAALPPAGEVGGRWSRQGGGEWSFFADSDRSGSRDLSATIPSPESCPRLFFVGDSHSRGAARFLEAQGFVVPIFHTRGIMDHYIPRQKDAKKEAERGNCSYQDFTGGDGPGSTMHVAADPTYFIHDLKADDVVVFGAGTWDMRDSSVEELEHDFAILSRRLVEVSKLARVVYRTAPAYSYRRDAFEGREMRTNEKLMEANAKVRRMLPKEVGLWDSFSVTMPRFEESCDTHHYICNGGPLEENRIGIADLSLFLSTVCETRNTIEVNRTPQLTAFERLLAEAEDA